MAERTAFELVLIKPSHYDDDGYVIQWLRSGIPSNSLAVLYGLAEDCADRAVLGRDVDINITVIDETNTRVRPKRLARQIQAAGAGLVGLVGVQSNQFPRAMDIARVFRKADVPVCIGGFHVSGCLAMLDEPTPELKEAFDLGISLFAGEAEGGRFDQVLKDAASGDLKPVYNHLRDLPDMTGTPSPILPTASIQRTMGSLSSFDAGRGCPFQCSFCTIINVQGRKSRNRAADDVERLVRANLEQGIMSLFITDDNFARNKNWEPILDRLIDLREREGLAVHLIIQVDTLCHKIPNFVEKCAAAGVRRVFIGLENINPDNLIGAKKRQNKITEYREMLLAWKDARIITYAGYILGFPGDTPESILRDIRIIKRELPVDLLEFFYLTPLPGSEDHKTLLKKGVPMSEDLNGYDLNHVTVEHPNMTAEEWRAVYRQAWDEYYDDAHVETILRRVAAKGISVGKMLFLMVWFYGGLKFEKLHPLEVGYFRRKHRLDRRPELPIENPLIFYPRRIWEVVRVHAGIGLLYWKWGRYRARIKKDADARNYLDSALEPPSREDFEVLEMFTMTAGAQGAVKRATR